MNRPANLFLDLAAQGLLARALENAAKKGFPSVEGVVSALRAGDPWAHSLFRYALAQELCVYLAQLCPSIRRVYLYGSVVDNRAGPASDVDIIVWVRRKLAALESLLCQLDALLLRGYQVLTHFRGPPTLFDFHVVDDTEVEEARDYGAVIRSLWTAPVPLQLPEERTSWKSVCLT
ncbi:nucleotidyltransferase domain-containing protein [Candidatus Bipolaricaulota bacterium]|nr:nucleotidyltransferase domain-containing protein [Candidatus Bipolaricaulota bacterium]